MNVTLRTMNVRERAGEPDSRYFELDFVEYRAPRVARKQFGDRHELPALIEINANGVAHEIKRGGKKLQQKQRHQIGSGSRPATLRSLAKHFYGSPKKWREIKRKNQPVRLKIPALEDHLEGHVKDFSDPGPSGGARPR